MKRMRRIKWAVLGVSLVVFLAGGTAAWAAATTGAGQDPGGTTAGISDRGDPGLCLATGETAGRADMASLKDVRTKIKERRDRFIQRQETLYNLLRDKMTPADRAKYDELVKQAKGQRDALEAARSDLQKTVSELRNLVQKYIDAQSSGGSTATQ